MISKTTYLPNFIVAGAKKAATTSIYNYLSQHPQVYVSPLKETRYFSFDPTSYDHLAAKRDVFPIRTLPEYSAQFADAGDAIAIGEVSPDYLDSPIAAEKISRLLPWAKIIFSLRNPIDRIYSSYLMRVRGGAEKRSLMEALREDKEKLEQRTYYNLLLPWYRYIGEDKIRIILYENFKDHEVDLMLYLYYFLGVDASFIPDTSVKHNLGGKPKREWLQSIINRTRQYRHLKSNVPSFAREKFARVAKANLLPAEPMDLEAREFLRQTCSRDTGKLQALIGMDLSVWSSTHE